MFDDIDDDLQVLEDIEYAMQELGYLGTSEYNEENFETTAQQCSSCGFVVAVSHCDYCGVQLHD